EHSRLVVLNGTRYGFARGEGDHAPLNGFSEVEISHQAAPFTLAPTESSDPGRRGGALRFAFNIALPHGIDISSADDLQKTLLRVDTSRSKGLTVRDPKMLKPGDGSLEISYFLNGEQKKLTVVAPNQGVTYVCQIVEK
ncbi:MAG: hypothetical protein ACREAC_00040, partial [Blastocatellia bacterium]